MSIAVASARDVGSVGERSDVVRRTVRPFGPKARVDLWLPPNAAVGLRVGPELFLACESDDLRAGARGKAAILGYRA